MRICGVLLALVLVGVTAGCASGPTAAPPPRTTLTIATAASLGGVYQQLADRFRSTHPDVDVRLDLANSAQLAQQVVQGAPIDVFAPASQDTMDVVTRAGLAAAPPVAYASNRLEIAVAPGNPKNVQGFGALADPGLRVVTTAVQTPCGAATAEVARRTGTALHPVSEQADVTGATAAVTTGNADAAVVFVTDVAAAGNRVTGIGVPEGDAVPVRYPIAVVRTTSRPDLARDWVSLVTGPEGTSVLSAADFGRP